MPVRVSCHEVAALCDFRVLFTEPGRYGSPEQLPSFEDALPAQVPTTAAGVLFDHKQLDLSQPPPLDDRDVWFRAVLPDDLPAGVDTLRFEGLATLCDVWLDGRHVLHSENMFRSHDVALDGVLTSGSVLVVRCAALSKNLAQKRPRPRHKTRLVDNQQLRYLRTSLLGRTPGFSPRVPIVGPYRPVLALASGGVRLVDHTLQTTLTGGGAALAVSLYLTVDDRGELPTACLHVEGDAANGHGALSVARVGEQLHVHGTLSFEQVKPWWPHTHGAQPRSRVSVVLDGLAQELTFDLGNVGFRSIEVDSGADGQGFALVVNGARIFCRGAVWTAEDLLYMRDVSLEQTLDWCVEAGMNMLRVAGTTTYQSDAFYEACDARGILLFHDVMLANMDYPASDAAFLNELTSELRCQLTRLQGRPSLAVLCGGSEVEQQIAMLGLPRDQAQPELLYKVVRELCASHRPDVPYVTNSPSGGTLPFTVDAGITHYYGVGAYLRPLSDVRISRVRFAAECLAFANVPSARAIESFMRDLEMPFHHPRWKERVPRDRGVGWDFDDVRDHYVELLYRVDARRLRYEDPERYLALSRAVVVDVMEYALTELRVQAAPRHGHRPDCGGALIYWLKDLWMGAGWGVLDARGEPKSAYYGLKRVMAEQALLISDEGMNGPALHVANDGDSARSATLHVALFRAGKTLVTEGAQPIALTPRSMYSVAVDALLPRFADPGYLYRFGPANHDLLVARLLDAEGNVLQRVFWQPLGRDTHRADVGLRAAFETRGGRLGVLVTSDAFAARVELEVDGYLPLDNYFHLEPNGQHWVPLRALSPRSPPDPKPRGRVSALNASALVNIAASSDSS